MRLKTYQDAGGFLEKAQNYLERQESANNLMLGLALKIEKNPKPYGNTPYLATVEDGAGLALAAVMTPPYNLVIYSDREHPEEAVQAVGQNLLNDNWPVPGVNGPSVTSKCFAERWAQLAKVPCLDGMCLRVYELHEVTFPAQPQGAFRQAVESDVALVAEWLSAFNDEALPNDPDTDTLAMAKGRVAEGAFYLWENEVPVTMAATARPTRNGITVNAVYTPPQLRRRGYASACVAALSQRMLEQGWTFCSLFTDLSNPVSNSIYQKVGYRPVCDYDEYKFGQRSEP